jgi:C_GCAxxG_C_C family probable redox protein
LLAVCQELGIESEIIPRVATPFGGGIGRTGRAPCGAVTGSVMAIGLKLGREEPWQPRDNAYAVAQEFCQRFREEAGHLRCRDLTGIDFTAADWHQAYERSDTHARVCLPAVGAAFRLVTELLERPDLTPADD